MNKLEVFKVCSNILSVCFEDVIDDCILDV